MFAKIFIFISEIYKNGEIQHEFTRNVQFNFDFERIKAGSKSKNSQIEFLALTRVEFWDYLK